MSVSCTPPPSGTTASPPVPLVRQAGNVRSTSPSIITVEPTLASDDLHLAALPDHARSPPSLSPSLPKALPTTDTELLSQPQTAYELPGAVLRTETIPPEMRPIGYSAGNPLLSAPLSPVDAAEWRHPPGATRQCRTSDPQCAMANSNSPLSSVNTLAAAAVSHSSIVLAQSLVLSTSAADMSHHAILSGGAGTPRSAPAHALPPRYATAAIFSSPPPHLRGADGAAGGAADPCDSGDMPLDGVSRLFARLALAAPATEPLTASPSAKAAAVAALHVAAPAPAEDGGCGPTAPSAGAVEADDSAAIATAAAAAMGDTAAPATAGDRQAAEVAHELHAPAQQPALPPRATLVWGRWGWDDGDAAPLASVAEPATLANGSALPSAAAAACGCGGICGATPCGPSARRAPRDAAAAAAALWLDTAVECASVTSASVGGGEMGGSPDDDDDAYLDCANPSRSAFSSAPGLACVDDTVTGLLGGPADLSTSGTSAVAVSGAAHTAAGVVVSPDVRDHATTLDLSTVPDGESARGPLSALDSLTPSGGSLAVIPGGNLPSSRRPRRNSGTWRSSSDSCQSVLWSASSVSLMRASGVSFGDGAVPPGGYPRDAAARVLDAVPLVEEVSAVPARGLHGALSDDTGSVGDMGMDASDVVSVGGSNDMLSVVRSVASGDASQNAASDVQLAPAPVPHVTDVLGSWLGMVLADTSSSVDVAGGGPHLSGTAAADPSNAAVHPSVRGSDGVFPAADRGGGVGGVADSLGAEAAAAAGPAADPASAISPPPWRGFARSHAVDDVALAAVLSAYVGAMVPQESGALLWRIRTGLVAGHAGLDGPPRSTPPREATEESL